MKKIMFVFNSETLRHLLEQLKVQIDKKIDIEQYAIKAEETDEDALLVGGDKIQLDNPLIVDLIAKGEQIKNGDYVLIKNKVLSEAVFTQIEKDALKEIIDGGGIESILNNRLDNLNFELVTSAEYNELLESAEGPRPNCLYIVTDEDNKALRIDEYMTKEELKEIANGKVDKDGNKVLSERDFTEAHAAVVDGILTAGGLESVALKSEIEDSLTSTNSQIPLSANQGKIIKDEYLAGKRHIYLSQSDYDALGTKEEDVVYHVQDAEVLYGLSEEQMSHLKAAYEHTLIDMSQEYASKSEVYQARKNMNGIYFSNLADRLFDLDNTLDQLIYDMDGLNDIVQYYGIHVDFEEQEIYRLGKGIGKEGGDDFNTCFPWAGIRRCNVLNGEVVAYENDDTYIEDGSNGDVMVEIPKFYYKVIPIRTEPAATGEGLQLVEAEWLISPNELPTFKIHPAFVRKNGQIINAVYIGAFEGSLYDVSANAFIANDEVKPDYNIDTIASVANVKPFSDVDVLTISKCRKLCNNKGIENFKYGQFDFTTLSAIQLLFLIEHASFFSNEILGKGIFIENSSTEASNLAKPTNSENAVLYRGIENLYGNTAEYIDGININSNSGYVYWANYDMMSDTGSNGYTKINFKYINDSGYITRFGYDAVNDFCFIPTKFDGASNIFPGGYCWHKPSNTSEWKVCSTTSYASNMVCNIFSSSFDRSETYASSCARRGCRLQFTQDK